MSAIKRACCIHFCSAETVKTVLEENEINMEGLMFPVFLKKQLL